METLNLNYENVIQFSTWHEFYETINYFYWINQYLIKEYTL